LAREDFKRRTRGLQFPRAGIAIAARGVLRLTTPSDYQALAKLGF